MKKLFVAAAIVLGTVAFSACDSKPAASEAASEAVDSVADVATEAVDSTAEVADSTINAITDSVK